MAEPLRIGVTGAGKLGTQLTAAAQGAGARIVAVHDIDLGVAQRLAADRPGAAAVASLDDLFAIPMDGLIVTTIPTVRLEPIERACQRGIHLLVEKPPAYDLPTGRACLAAIERAGVISAVGFNLRYTPRYEKLRELVAGRTVHLARTVCTIDYYLNYRMSPWFLQKRISAGPIAEQAIHLLDCVRFVLGGVRPLRAVALGARNMELQRTEFDAENALQVMYELEGGVLGVHTNHCGHERFAFDLELIGPHLRLAANLTDPTIRGTIDGETVEFTPPQQNALGMDKVEAWLAAIRTGDRTLVRCDYAEALQTQSLVDAAIRSQSTGAMELAQPVKA